MLLKRIKKKRSSRLLFCVSDFYRFIPSFFTVLAFIFGFNAVVLATNYKIKLAIVFVIMSAFLDLFDGRVARLLGVSSNFGVQLDSLNDLVCFGIAGAFIVMFFNQQNIGFDNYKLLYVACTFFAIACMLRLARYNLIIYKGNQVSNNFYGVPVPAGFFLSILPISFFYAFDYLLPITYYAIYVILISFLLISNVPTVSTKNMQLRKDLLPIIFGLIILILVCLLFYTWKVIAILSIIYLLAVLLSCYNYVRQILS